MSDQEKIKEILLDIFEALTYCRDIPNAYFKDLAKKLSELNND